MCFTVLVICLSDLSYCVQVVVQSSGSCLQWIFRFKMVRVLRKYPCVLCAVNVIFRLELPLFFFVDDRKMMKLIHIFFKPLQVW